MPRSTLFAGGGGSCVLEFNATGHPAAVTLERASVTQSFSDRPARDAADLGASDFAQDFARDFAGDPPNVAIFGWTRSQPTSLVATATRADWRAGPEALRYDLVQFPEQTPATALGAPRARRAADRGGRVRLRRCTVFVDNALAGTPFDIPDIIPDNCPGFKEEEIGCVCSLMKATRTALCGCSMCE